MDARTAVTLAALAYRNDAISVLPQSLDGWKIAWWPDCEVHGNHAFVAADRAGNHALAIRGTVLSFSGDGLDDALEDLSILRQRVLFTGRLAPIPGHCLANLWRRWRARRTGALACVSEGTWVGLEALDRLTDSRSGTPLTLRQFLQGVADQGELTITGHSLGGALATAVAHPVHGMADTVHRKAPVVYTFGATAAGNQAFADHFDRHFGERSWRYVVERDVVPCFPVPSHMARIARWYPGEAKLVSWVDRVVATLERWFGSNYAQTNERRGTIRLATDKGDGMDWLSAVACRHEVTTYAAALGAPELPPPAQAPGMK